MKLRHKIKPNTILAYVLLVLFALNCLASYQSDIFVFKDVDVLISKITTLITTTILLTFYFAQKNRMATVFFTINWPLKLKYKTMEKEISDFSIKKYVVKSMSKNIF